MMIPSYFLENGTLITPLLLLSSYLGPVSSKNYRFAEYVPVEFFNKFLQAAVNARRERVENPNSSVVAETRNLLANSTHG